MKFNVASIIRQAGERVKRLKEDIIEEAQELQNQLPPGQFVVPSVTTPKKLNIYNVMQYIEEPWGIGLPLYPVQKFIVKLYYNLPLNSKDKTIEIYDMFRKRLLYKFTEVEYLDFLFKEGRCNIQHQDHMRRELILAIGRRGGKCLNGRTVVLTGDGPRFLEEMGDINGPEYQHLQVTVAQEGNRRSTSAFFYNGGKQDTVLIKTHCGFEIEGTPNHRVKVMAEDGTIQWRYMAEMRVGDRPGIHRKTDLWAADLVDTMSYLEDLGGNKRVQLPRFFNSNWGTLLGILVGDGTWGRPSHIEVTVGPYPEWLEKIQKLFQSTVGDHNTVIEKRTGRAYRVRFFSYAVRSFLDRLGYNLDAKSDNKKIPWVIWRSPKSVVASFLRGLFETDGSVEGGRKVSFSTASIRLAQEVQLLLLNFGIVSRVKSKTNKKYNKAYYHLTIVGAESVRIFACEIGFLSDRKKGLLQAHIDKGDLGNKSDTEQIPHQRVWLERLLGSVPKNNGNPNCSKLGLRRSKLRVVMGNTCKPSTEEQLSYARLQNILNVAREVGADKTLIEHFEDIIEAGYFYDKIVSVSKGNCHVYDLTVPDGESFVANGMTNHNTTLSGIFASYEIYRLLNLFNPQKYFGLPPGNRIQIISVGTDKDQAAIMFNEVTSHLSRCTYFDPYIANNTQSYIQFRTPSDIEKFGDSKRQENGKFVSFNGKATIRVTFKSCIAKGLRGAGNICVILDEMAHYVNKGNSSAEAIYNAVAPSAAAFSPKDPEDTSKPIGDVESRIICISSPLNKNGKFFELFDMAMHGGEASTNMLAIQAPTWVVNPTVPSSFLVSKFHADPNTFMTEYGAEFSDRIRSWIEREEDLQNCIREDYRPVTMGKHRCSYYMGIDLGLVKDGTAIVIMHQEDGIFYLDYHEVWTAGVPWKQSNPHLTQSPIAYTHQLQDEKRLEFDEIENWIVKLCDQFYIARGVFDRWNGLPLEQRLKKRGFNNFTSELFTPENASRVYQNAKLLIYSKQVVLYDYPVSSTDPKNRHSPFINELLCLQAEQRSRNVVKVAAPNQEGYHDDISDAFVRSLWLCSQVATNHSTGSAHYAQGSSERIRQVSSAQKARYILNTSRSAAKMRIPPRRGR